MTAAESGQRFHARARLVQSNFVIEESTAPAVANICARLDGIPLALELAAARLRILSVHELARRLDNARQLLVSGNQTAPARPQTLRATLGWRYSMLPEPERRLPRGRAVFAGSWTLEASESVCSADGVGQPDVLDRLTALI